MKQLLQDLDRAIAHQDFGVLREDQLRVPGVEPAVRMALWLVDDPRGARVLPEVLGDQIEPLLLDRLVRLGLRQAWLDFDSSNMRNWVARSPAQTSGSLIAKGVGALLGGNYKNASELFWTAAQHGEDASTDQTCEARTWLALAALENADIQTALQEARFATQASKDQVRPSDHLFASLALARARRCAGHPHLSVFITSRLQGRASSPWIKWCEWERVLAGDQATFDRPRDLSTEPAVLLMNTFRGEQTERQKAFAKLHETLGADAGPFSNDCLDLATLLGADADSTGTVAAQDWARGESRELPRGLEAAAISAFGGTSQGTQRHPIGVLLKANGQCRRTLRTAEADALDIADDKNANQQRTLSAVAYLALAEGEAVDFAPFFEDLYGFSYDPQRHQSVLDTLIGRMRALVESRAELRREDNRLQLVAQSALFCPDPRCEVTAKDHMLYVLAQGGPATARGLSEHLGMPLRTVQEVLRELKESGACDANRNGRVVEYSVEDSIYLEPTITLPSFSIQ